MSKSGWRFNKPPTTEPLKKYLDEAVVEVGIFSDAPDYPDGTPILVVAHANEFGGKAGSPPPRNWLKKSVGKDKAEYQEHFRKLLKKPKGIERTTLLKAVGRIAVENVQDHLERNDIGMAANKESTQRAKGGNSPMIDTQHLIRNINYKIGDKF